MRGRGGIAHQHDILVGPVSHSTRGKFSQRRAAQMARIRHQRVAAEIFAEEASRRRRSISSLAHRAEAELVPGLLRALDDESRGVGVELVGVRPDPAVLGFFEDEGEGVVEFLVRAEPDELVFAQVDAGLESASAKSVRIFEFKPSAATTRSWVFAIASQRSRFRSRKRSVTPSESARCCSSVQQLLACRCRKSRVRSRRCAGRDNARRCRPNRRNVAGSLRR